MRLFILVLGVHLLVLVGCTTRQPGDAFPWVTESKWENDVIYHGIGLGF